MRFMGGNDLEDRGKSSGAGSGGIRRTVPSSR